MGFWFRLLRIWVWVWIINTIGPEIWEAWWRRSWVKTTSFLQLFSVIHWSNRTVWHWFNNWFWNRSVCVLPYTKIWSLPALEAICQLRTQEGADLCVQWIGHWPLQASTCFPLAKAAIYSSHERINCLRWFGHHSWHKNNKVHSNQFQSFALL